MLEIKIINTASTLDIRHKVMWPNKPKAYVELPNDQTAIHFGLFQKNMLVSVISLFEKDKALQFRKFATLQEYQGYGYGSKLLQHTIEYAISKGFKKLWCNARLDKTTLYHKFDLKETNQTFKRGSITYVIMERFL